MKFYKVGFKNGATRTYFSDFECKVGEYVVADTSHGPLVGIVDEELGFPAIVDPSNARCLLCTVPDKREDIAQEIKVERKKRIKELEEEMEKISTERCAEIMRRVFADYDCEYRKLLHEYEKHLCAEKKDREEDCDHAMDAEASSEEKENESLPGDIIE